VVPASHLREAYAKILRQDPVTRYSMSAICTVLGIARRTAYYIVRARPGGRYHRADDPTVLQQTAR